MDCRESKRFTVSFVAVFLCTIFLAGCGGGLWDDLYPDQVSGTIRTSSGLSVSGARGVPDSIGKNQWNPSGVFTKQ